MSKNSSLEMNEDGFYPCPNCLSENLNYVMKVDNLPAFFRIKCECGLMAMARSHDHLQVIWNTRNGDTFNPRIFDEVRELDEPISGVEFE